MSKIELLNKATLTENNLRMVQDTHKELVGKHKVWEAKFDKGGETLANEPTKGFNLADLSEIVSFMSKYIIKLEEENNKLRTEIVNTVFEMGKKLSELEKKVG